MQVGIVVIILGFSVVLGLIPASIASKKGRDFVLWWIYGTLLFIIALIHAALLNDGYLNPNDNSNNVLGALGKTTTADVLLKFKEALDVGAITQEDYLDLTEYYKNIGGNKL